MVAAISADPTQVMAEHLSRLKTYANRVIVRREFLRPEEENDRESRVREFLALGKSFGCSQKELVTLLYAEVFQEKWGCDCGSCRLRRATWDSPAP